MGRRKGESSDIGAGHYREPGTGYLEHAALSLEKAIRKRLHQALGQIEND